MFVQTNRPEIVDANDFNELAHRREWAVLCDVACRFLFTPFDELHALWRSKAGPTGIPARSEMTARLLKPHMKTLTIHERIHGEDGTRRYRMRLVGSTVTQVIGEVSGKFYDEFLPAKSLPIWNAMSDVLLRHGAPLRMLIRPDEFNKTHLVGEFFAAPLLAADGAANLLLSIGHFDGNLRWEDLVNEFWYPEGVA